MNIHSLISCLLFYWNVVGTFCHVLVIAAIYQFCSVSKQPAYLLMLSLSVSDALCSTSYMVGCVGTFIWSTTGFEFHPWFGRALGIVINGSWCSLSLHLQVMAVNRFIGTFFPMKYKGICNPRNTRFALGSIWLGAVISGTIRQVWICCPTVYKIEAAGSGYQDPPANQTLDIMGTDMPFSLVTIVVPGAVYTAITLKLLARKLHMSNAGIVSQVDINLCKQFIFVLLIATTEPFAFYIVQFIAPSLWTKFFVSIVETVNFTANPFIYFKYNRTIQEACKKVLEKYGIGKPDMTAVISTASVYINKVTSRANNRVHTLG